MGNDMKMSYGYGDDKPAILKRLRRAEGQVRGIERMVEDDTYCIDILTQVAAVRSALDGVALELLRGHTAHCLTSTTGSEDKDVKATELVNAIKRML